MRTPFACLICLAFAANTFAADPLTIGDPAPPLTLKAFLKGEPVKELKKGTVYVIEFSGTQCAPCVEAMPILSRLQQKYSKVPFVSIYTEKPDVVKEYVEKNKDKMGFAVAADDELKTGKAWMEAAVMGGIPCLFIVNAESKIAWIGMPFEMEKPLEEIVKGTHNIGRARAEAQLMQAVKLEETAIFDSMENYNQTRRDVNRLIEKKEYRSALNAVERAIKDNPNWEYGLYNLKLEVLFSDPDSYDEAARFVKLIYGKSFANKLGVGLYNPTLYRYCSQYASTLIEHGQEKQNTFCLVSAEKFIERGEELIDSIKVYQIYGPREKQQSAENFKGLRARLAAARKEWDRAIQYQKELIEMIRAEQIDLSRETEKEWKEKTAKRVKYCEEQLARFINEKDKANK